MPREKIEMDVVVVGAGPAGLSSGIRLKQLNPDLSVLVLDKGARVGSHIMSGAILDPGSLAKLLPNQEISDLTGGVEVSAEKNYWFRGAEAALGIPDALIPPSNRNAGNWVISLGRLCRNMAAHAEGLGVQILSGYTAVELLYDGAGHVVGVLTDDKGLDRDGVPTATFTPGVEVHARYTLLAEGSRGNLAREVISRFGLGQHAHSQHYALGIKEVWNIDKKLHKPGLVIHASGWPLVQHQANGGGFLYHGANNQVHIGLITDLDYRNPSLSPHDEFQRFKTHPVIKQYLMDGDRVCYGARTLTKGGLNALPRQNFPGGCIIGCDSGTLNGARQKGIHTAIQSGMIAAESIMRASDENHAPGDLELHETAFRNSDLYQELYRVRNYSSSLRRFGMLIGSIYNWMDQKLFPSGLPITFADGVADNTTLNSATGIEPVEYPRYDGKITFDRMSSLFLSGTSHIRSQPVHIKLDDASIPVRVNLERYNGPERYYCPAGVYEYVGIDSEIQLQINAENCLHCKTCDIKDPTGNIHWTPPEGGGGPNYVDM